MDMSNDTEYNNMRYFAGGPDSLASEEGLYPGTEPGLDPNENIEPGDGGVKVKTDKDKYGLDYKREDPGIC